MGELALGWPQLTYLGLLCLSLGLELAKHGEPRTPHNIWTTLVATGLVLPILYYGGFFTA